MALLTLLGEGGEGGAGLDPVGLLCAFGAAACYAAYILFTDKVGAAFQGFQGLAVSMTVGALVVAPFGLGEAWDGLSAPDASPLVLLLAVAGVSLLLPVIPYALEMTALRRMPQRVFSVLVSLEPHGQRAGRAGGARTAAGRRPAGGDRLCGGGERRGHPDRAALSRTVGRPGRASGRCAPRPSAAVAVLQGLRASALQALHGQSRVRDHSGVSTGPVLV